MQGCLTNDLGETKNQCGPDAWDWLQARDGWAAARTAYRAEQCDGRQQHGAKTVKLTNPSRKHAVSESCCDFATLSLFFKNSKSLHTAALLGLLSTTASGSTMAEKTARESVIEVMVNGVVHVIDDATAREHRMDGSFTLVKFLRDLRTCSS
jgi:hypothetical protein